MHGCAISKQLEYTSQRLAIAAEQLTKITLRDMHAVLN